MKDYPLFPLNIFLLPGEYTQLYIFEERYKQLINEAWENKSSFGIPFSNKLNARNYGTMVEVHEVVSRSEGGEMEIIVKAIGNFRLDKFYYQVSGKLYPAGDVDPLNDEIQSYVSEALYHSFRAYLVKHEHYDVELLAKERFSYNELPAVLNFNDQEKLEFVGLSDKAAMDSYLRNYLRYLDLLHEQESRQYKNFYLN